MDKITECSLVLGPEEFSANRHGTLQVFGKGVLFSPSWVSSTATQDYGGLRFISKVSSQHKVDSVLGGVMMITMMVLAVAVAVVVVVFSIPYTLTLHQALFWCFAQVIPVITML